MVARFLQVPVWELSRVAVHYQDEAAIILRGQYEAKLQLVEDIRAKGVDLKPNQVILPEF